MNYKSEILIQEYRKYQNNFTLYQVSTLFSLTLNAAENSLNFFQRLSWYTVVIFDSLCYLSFDLLIRIFLKVFLMRSKFKRFLFHKNSLFRLEILWLEDLEKEIEYRLGNKIKQKQ